MPTDQNEAPTRVALAMGDPAGISSELSAQIAADQELATHARLIIIGDRREFAKGCEVAGVSPTPADWQPGQAWPHDGHAFYDLGHGDPGQFRQGQVSLAGGQFALRNFVTALEFGRDGLAEAVAFTPFNKQAMRMARPGYDDEIGVVSEVLDAPEGREFNILGNLWNARVTSHIALKDVAASLTKDAVAKAGRLAHRSLVEAGVAAPRIAVAALNPHAGDGGNFGREEIDILGPAIVQLQQEALDVTGPVPADTVFVRANKGEFDVVLTMYHDQGQIAMKLLGFDRGVTLLGGYAIPICTPAHGTAYDIAGQGIANTGASFNAIRLAANMGKQQRSTSAVPA